MLYRQKIYNFLCQEVRRLSGKIKCDARCFGGKRTGTKGRGSAGTIKVFSVLGMVERHGKLFTTM